MATREQVMGALFNVLAASYPFKASGRRLRDPENVPSDKRPAFYLVQHQTEYSRPELNTPPIRIITAYAVIYTDTGTDQNAIPETETNNILDAFDAAIAPGLSDDGRQTLGGLVYDCNIKGHVERESGDVTGKSIVGVPIEIILP